MSQTPAAQVPSGWYPDPERPSQQRFWNGSAWSDDVRNTAQAAALPPSSANPVATPAGRRSWLKPVSIGVIALLVIVSGGLGFLWFSTKSTLSDTQGQLVAKTNQANQLQTDLVSTQSQLTEARTQLTSAQSDAATAKADAAAARTASAQKDAEIGLWQGCAVSLAQSLSDFAQGVSQSSVFYLDRALSDLKTSKSVCQTAIDASGQTPPDFSL